MIKAGIESGMKSDEEYITTFLSEELGYLKEETIPWSARIKYNMYTLDPLEPERDQIM